MTLVGYQLSGGNERCDLPIQGKVEAVKREHRDTNGCTPNLHFQKRRLERRTSSASRGSQSP